MENGAQFVMIFWGLTDADVVCREIGCPYGAIEAPRNAEFGEGTGTIWLMFNALVLNFI